MCVCPSVTRENPKETPSPAATRGTRRARRMSGTPRTTCWPWRTCFATMDARRPRRCPRPSMTTTCQSRRRGMRVSARSRWREKIAESRCREACVRRSGGLDIDARERDDIASRASVHVRLAAGVRRRRLARRRGASGSTLGRYTIESPGRVWRKRAGTRPIRARARRARVTASEGRREEDKADTHLIHDVQLIRYACRRDRGKPSPPRRWRFSAEADSRTARWLRARTESPLPRRP